MAVDILGATINTPIIFIIVAIIAYIIGGFITFLMLMFTMQIPNYWSQIKCQMKRQASVSMHYVNRRMELFAPKRQGKDKQKNTLDLPKALGAKFDPSGEGMEEIWGKSINYHFFSKTSYPIKPLDAKAVQDFYDFLGEKGIRPNKALIDFLLVENMDTLEVYTTPLQEWVTKNLPLPINTVKEYLLDKSVIDEDFRENTIAINNLQDEIDKFESNEELKDEDVKQLEKMHLYMEKLLTIRSDIERRESEYQELQNYKKQLIETDDSIKALHEKRIGLIENIDILTGYLDKETKETVYTLRRLKDDLKKKTISEGLFVFPKVQELIFAASSLNSSGMNEAVSIANADAYMQNTQDPGGFTLEKLAAVAVILIVVLVGGGIAIKAAFG